MRRKTWRDIANMVIEDVIVKNPDLSADELERLIREAYPFGPRRYHPYKIWCSAVRQYMERIRRPARERSIEAIHVDDVSAESLPLFEVYP